MKLAFVILSHSAPSQLLRLVRALNANFAKPTIVCHHDQSKCPLDSDLFPDNVRFVTPSLVTTYGRMSVVHAGLLGFGLAYQEEPKPDWYYLLSGSDYPILRADDVYRALSGASCNVFIDHRRITFESYRESAALIDDTSQVGFDRPGYTRLAYDRYLAKRIVIPHPRHILAPPALAALHIRSPILLGPNVLNKHGLVCYAGEHWFTLDRKAVAKMLGEAPWQRQVLSYLQNKRFVDECAYHTLLANDHDLTLCNDNLRYIKWESATAPNPKWLDMSDAKEIGGSRAHFARKIAPNSEILDWLDQRLGIVGQTHEQLPRSSVHAQDN